MTAGVAAGRYNALKTNRDPYLTRAREAASLTVPHLFPEEGTNGSTPLYQPYQSLGARGLRNLASKILLATLPVNTPFFKYAIDDMLVEEITKKEGARAQIDMALSRRERAVMQEVERSQLRPVAFEVNRQLLVSGNALLHVPKKDKARYFRLDSYVCKRDPMGTLLELIIEERLSFASLPEDVALIVKAKNPKVDEGSDQKTICLYTHIKLLKGKYHVYQEVEAVEVPGSRGTYKPNKLPYLALRFTRMDGEDYGRGYVEEFIGDLTALEGLCAAIVEGSAAAAKVVFMVNPNGTTKLHVIAKAKNLDVVHGNAEDVTVLHVEKNADFSVAKAQAEEIANRLAFAFLLNTAIQRGGDRVTAEEIRYMAEELDASLGGVYSLLSVEMQLPLVPLYEARMESVRKVPGLPEGTVSPAIVTGMDALGRGNDLRNLDAFLAGLLQLLGPEILLKFLNASDYMKRRAAALGIDPNGLILDEQAVQGQDQQQQLMAMIQQLGPDVIKQLGGAAQTDMKNQAQKEIAQQNGK